jgi:hypothetical protein
MQSGPWRLAFLVYGVSLDETAASKYRAHEEVEMNAKVTGVAITVAGFAAVAAPTGSAKVGAEKVREASATPPRAQSAARRKRVPNEIGKNHQAAQDDLQAHGFFNLSERDCTGRGRHLIFDRNWKVKRQSPRPGRRVSTNTRITLCSVKYSD